MFTVRHIHLSGEEEIIPVSTVRFQPGSSAQSTDRPVQSTTPPTLWIRDGIIDERPLTGGTVFVMNEQGKTVARYDLGASPVPIIGDGLTDPRPRGIGVGIEAARAPRY